VLVNSAGQFRAGDVRSLPVAEWDLTMDLNVRAPFLCAREAAARMTRGGLIVNITDVGARKSWSRFPAYVASKAGLEALTRVLARTYAPDIRVNAIAPGLILPSQETSPSDWQRLTARLPMKRPGTTEEIGAAFEFLLQNEYVTGQTLVVDGGYSLVA
jgi:pteridine reductase